ncbi:MAG: response regulator transcription factor [Bdellovibrionales bacterium]|nr:response regulator transcription factor [Bdellovibrionales bacterium]
MEKSEILIVDDEKDLADSLSFYLHLNGYSPSIALSAAEAIHLVDKNTKLVISDICMPGANGIDMLKKMAEKLGYEPNTIFLSGFTQESHKKLGEVNPLEVLSKPVDLPKLLNYLRLYV